MLAAILGLLLCPAWAEDDAPPPRPADGEETSTETPPDPKIAVLEARIAALEAAQAQAALADLLRDAEAAAATAPAPPPPTQTSASAFNPGLTAFGDGFWSMGLDDDGVNPASGPWMRSLELDLRAAVDPYATAVAVIALHQDPPLGGGHDGEEPGAEGEEPGWEVAAEEVYVDFVALPYGLSARAGLSLLPLGMANRQHPHDLPWTQAPLAHRELLGAESLSDVGLTVSWQPRLRGPIALTATAAALSGGDFETGTLTPGWLGRGEAFTEVGAFDLSLGATGVGRGADAVLGGDLMVRWKGSSWRSFLLLAEALATTDGGAGGYAAVQLQPTRLVYVGARVDRLPGEWGAEGVLSWYASEFLRLRLSLAREEAAWLAQSQLTFVWGSHPVEPYWVNR